MTLLVSAWLSRAAAPLAQDQEAKSAGVAPRPWVAWLERRRFWTSAPPRGEYFVISDAYRGVGHGRWPWTMALDDGSHMFLRYTCRASGPSNKLTIFYVCAGICVWVGAQPLAVLRAPRGAPCSVVHRSEKPFSAAPVSLSGYPIAIRVCKR